MTKHRKYLGVGEVKMKKYLVFLIILLLATNMACEAAEYLKKRKETKVFIYYSMNQDIKVLKDIEKILEDNYQRICNDLKYQYQFKINVEIYPDQKTYDENMSDRSVIGSPACSGKRKIQLVSPASPIRVSGIPYKERLRMAVHEFAHLMINEINNNVPIWLNEGIASHEGSPEGYDSICKIIFPKIPVIHFAKLEQSYHEIPAPDIYSSSAVRFIIEYFGYDKLNQLIRNPLDFEEILSMTKDQFSKEWNVYIQSRYRNK